MDEVQLDQEPQLSQELALLGPELRLRRQKARERVAKGLAWLLESGPLHGLFIADIDLDILDLSDCSRCVLGQLGGDYSDVIGEIDPDADDEHSAWAIEHGLEAENSFVFAVAVRYGDLNVAWREAILDYRAMVKAAHPTATEESRNQ